MRFAVMSRSFLDASIPYLVEQLTVDEKISLLGAPNWWNTSAIKRLEIPAIRMSDGPNGVRGSSHFVSTPAQCLPCATSLASTFDTDLVHSVGNFLAEEAKVKSSIILLAPTCNIQRSPLSGRAFESFSEDPHLSGTLAAAYVNGLQSKGVAATIKHFVGNDQEHERTAADSVISDRALREVYLYPFMLAQKHAQPWAFMTSYGRIGGVHCSENPILIQGILRKEWKFDGIIMSDWFGTYGVDEPLNAGLDLEMPGPPRWRTSLLIHHCLACQKLFLPTVNERVANMLTFIQKMARKNPEVVYGDGSEGTRDSAQVRAFCRKVAADGMVLLQNDKNVLPFTSQKIKKLAVIGPNARGRVISGGGSAALKANYIVTPWEGILNNAPPGIELKYEVGCYAHKYLPTLEENLVTQSGEPGWLCTFYNHDAEGHLSEEMGHFVLYDTRIKLNDFLPAGLTTTWSIKLRGLLTMAKTATYELGLTVAGRGKLWVDKKLIIDNWTKQTPGDFFYGQGTVEEKATVDLIAGKAVEILVEYTNTPPDSSNGGMDCGNTQPALMRGVRLGGCEKIDSEHAIAEAINLASGCDAVVFIGGLTPEWESEGFDRPTLDMPGEQDELIRQLGKINPNTVVVLQTGSAVSMPWVGDVGGILQAWYSGNEVGNAIADILFGKVNPSGCLPLTFPVRLVDIPAYPNLHSDNGRICYEEGIYVGYKHYQAKKIKPLFGFGSGLSYTKFSYDRFSITPVTSHDELFRVTITLTISNVGSVSGSKVIQAYVEFPDVGVTIPSLQLKGFAKARNIPPGGSQEVTIILDKYAISFWDSEQSTWNVPAGKYRVFLAYQGERLEPGGEFELHKSFYWSGL